jgi:hypothetical protein
MLAAGRYSATATLLQNGEVLVAGGQGDSGVYLASAELYDPASNSWSAAASMTSARAYHTATLLQNGEVLVAGGQNNCQLACNYLASAELYNPTSNSWSAAGSMADARAAHTATLLQNGEVLVTGGYSSFPPQWSAELYDPRSNRWSDAGSMADARAYHTATLLHNGEVLVAGGNSVGGVLATAELYDPASNSWSAAGSLATARTFHTATLLQTGKVLVAGGQNNCVPVCSYLASAELYTPATSASVLDGDFGDQTVGEQSAVEYLPVTDAGDEPLFVTGTSISGADASDFSVVSDGCTNQTVAPGQSCWLGVRFTPGAIGARSATLTVAVNGQSEGQIANLSGTGMAANSGPQGSVGQPGPAGPAGATGATGPRGPAGEIELLTCRTVTRVVKHKKKTGQKCTAKLLSGPLDFTSAARARAMLIRHGRIYATGSVQPNGLVLLRARRLPTGRYTLVLTSDQGGIRHTITIR